MAAADTGARWWAQNHSGKRQLSQGAKLWAMLNPLKTLAALFGAELGFDSASFFTAQVAVKWAVNWKASPIQVLGKRYVPVVQKGNQRPGCC